MDDSKARGAVTPSAVLIEPVALTIADAVRLSGISRSELYRRLAAKDIAAVKRGRRTLIPLASLRAYLAGLPPAAFRNDARQSKRGAP